MANILSMGQVELYKLYRGDGMAPSATPCVDKKTALPQQQHRKRLVNVRLATS